MRLLLILLLCANLFAESVNIPGYGDYHWRAPVATSAQLPTLNNMVGDARVDNATQAVYIWSGSAWVPLGGGGIAVPSPTPTAGDLVAWGAGGTVADLGVLTNIGSRFINFGIGNTAFTNAAVKTTVFGSAITGSGTITGSTVYGSNITMAGDQYDTLIGSDIVGAGGYGSATVIGSHIGAGGQGAANVLIGASTAPAGIGVGNVCIGGPACTYSTGDHNVFVGQNSFAFNFSPVSEATALGNYAGPSMGSYSTAIGSHAARNNGGNYNIFLGYYADSNSGTVTNAFIVGAPGATGGAIYDTYIGSGMTAANASLHSHTMHATSTASGTANQSAAASTMVFAGAQGTGTGAGGDIIFQVAPHSTTASTNNTLVERVRIGAENGGLMLSPPQTTITGSAGTAVCSQPHTGSGYKKVVCYLSGFSNTSDAYTFPVAFTNTPYVYGAATAVAVSTGATTTLTFSSAVTITGFVFAEGY